MRRYSHGPGNGPLCPDNPNHGRLYTHTDWVTKPYWCPTASHGGNGAFFTEDEAYGDKQTEGQVSKVIEEAARDVISGAKTMDQAVTEVNRVTKRSTAAVRESLTVMIETIKDGSQSADVVEKRREARQVVRTAQQAKAASSRKIEKVPGEEWAKVRDQYGMTDKEVAQATGAYGMGASTTYVYILMHDGASASLFEKFKLALADWDANKAPAEAATA